MRAAPPSDGIERIEAFFSGHGFDPHRHDTYAIGYTIAGVQAFRYRGAGRQSLPGQVFVLHPDETHDGRAGTPAGFRYRILYVEPRLIGAALRRAAALRARRGVERQRGSRARSCRRSTISRRRWRSCSAIRSFSISPRRWPPWTARRARGADTRIGARCGWRANSSTRSAATRAAVTSAALEAVTGMTRYALARHFRACLGTSPYRYLVMRRLDRARA